MTRYPPNPDQVKKLVDSIGRTCLWNNLVVRPHPTEEGRYQLAYGHNRIAACRQIGITEADFEIIDLGDYDMLCCMIDENLTQQHVESKTVFEIVSAAIQEAEKMLRETNNVYDFNAYFKRSRGLSTLLQKSNRPDRDGCFSYDQEYYTQAKQAIEPSGPGLGKDFLRRFLPNGAVPRNGTLQAAITGIYEERWREEGDALAEQSRLMLWQAKETNDKDKIEAALELEKQAIMILGKIKKGGITRALLCSLSNNEKASDPEAAGKKERMLRGDYHCSGHSWSQM